MCTEPRVGKSRPPSNCNRVVLPEPEAPTMAMRSPAPTAMDAPRSTWRVTPPCVNSLTSPTPSSTLSSVSVMSIRSSIIAQGFGGQQARRAPGRIQSRKARQYEGECADLDDVRKPYVRRKIAHEIDARIQKFETDDVFQAVHETLQVERDQHAQEDPERDAQHSDETSLDDEDGQNAARRSAEGS